RGVGAAGWPYRSGESVQPQGRMAADDPCPVLGARRVAGEGRVPVAGGGPDQGPSWGEVGEPCILGSSWRTRSHERIGGEVIDNTSSRRASSSSIGGTSGALTASLA